MDFGHITILLQYGDHFKRCLYMFYFFFFFSNDFNENVWKMFSFLFFVVCISLIWNQINSRRIIESIKFLLCDIQMDLFFLLVLFYFNITSAFVWHLLLFSRCVFFSFLHFYALKNKKKRMSLFYFRKTELLAMVVRMTSNRCNMYILHTHTTFFG